MLSSVKALKAQIMVEQRLIYSFVELLFLMYWNDFNVYFNLISSSALLSVAVVVPMDAVNPGSVIAVHRIGCRLVGLLKNGSRAQLI